MAATLQALRTVAAATGLQPNLHSLRCALAPLRQPLQSFQPAQRRQAASSRVVMAAAETDVAGAEGSVPRHAA